MISGSTFSSPPHFAENRFRLKMRRASDKNPGMNVFVFQVTQETAPGLVAETPSEDIRY